MPNTMNNSANITYQYGEMTEGATSNTVTTELADSYKLTATKLSQNSSWKPGENLTYNIRIANEGSEPIYNVTIQDNLGNDMNELLEYISDSGTIIKNDIITTLIPTNTSPLTFTIPETLQSGEVIMLSYIAKVKNDISDSLTEITNTIIVSGNEESASGPVITVDPSPFITLPIANYAEVRIAKSVDKQNAFVGDELTYTFVLENAGNTEATNVIIRDSLPINFTITNITSLTEGVTTTFEATDYSLDANNGLILPTATTKTISVPAKTATENGTTIVTIVGTITN